MKFDEKKMEKAFEAFMKNPSHKSIYENAPSEECKRFYKSEYYFSKYYDPDSDDVEDFMKMVKEPEKDLSVEDWEYIRDHAGSGPFKKVCSDKIKELQGKK